MIAEQHASAKFQVISQMGVGILELKAQMATLNARLEVERARANKAERQVRQLEAQLQHPRYEAATLVHEVQGNDLRVKADRELTEYRNAGWQIDGVNAFLVDLGKIPQYIRVITLSRVAPLPIEPVQPAATVVAAAPTVKESQTVADPPPVTLRTVSASAIVGAEESPAPSVALSTKTVSLSEAVFLADLHTALQAKAEEIQRTNLLLNLPHRSFRSASGVQVQS